MTTIVFVLVCTFTFAQSTAQQIPIDSLVKSNREYPDSIELYFRISQRYIYQKPDSSEKYLRQVIGLVDQSKDSIIYARAFKSLGVSKSISGNFDSAIFYYDQAAAIFLALDHAIGYADALNNAAYTLAQIGSYTEALDKYHKAIDIYRDADDTFKVASTELNVGIMFQLNNDYQRALEKYREAIRITPLTGNQQNRIKALINIATIYNRQELYDSAKAIFLRSIPLLEESNNTLGLSIVMNNLGLIYININDPGSAIESFEASLKYKELLKDPRGLAITMQNLAEAYDMRNDYPKALSWAQKSLEMSRSIQSNKQILEALLRCADLKRKMKRFEDAVDYFDEYINLKDSIDQQGQSRAIQEIQEKYESEQKEREITQLELDNQQALFEAKQNQNQRNIVILIATLIIIVAIFLLLLLRSKQVLNKKLEHKNDIISTALKEKDVLLKEIHHRVKNNLQVVSSLLNLQSRYINDPSALDAVKEGRDRVKSMALIHQKLYQKDNLTGVNIQDYVENLCDNLRQSYGIDMNQILINYDVENLNLDIDTIIPLGLIINELVSNSFKHAFPDGTEGKIWIELSSQKSENLRLVVRDDGKGSLNKRGIQDDSFGMKLIDSLSRKLEGDVNVDASQGTCVTILFAKFDVNKS